VAVIASEMRVFNGLQVFIHLGACFSRSFSELIFCNRVVLLPVRSIFGNQKWFSASRCILKFQVSTFIPSALSDACRLLYSRWALANAPKLRSENKQDSSDQCRELFGVQASAPSSLHLHHHHPLRTHSNTFQRQKVFNSRPIPKGIFLVTLRIRQAVWPFVQHLVNSALQRSSEKSSDLSFVSLA
jgi:hypothetical protein